MLIFFVVKDVFVSFVRKQYLCGKKFIEKEMKNSTNIDFELVSPSPNNYLFIFVCGIEHSYEINYPLPL